KEVLESDQGTQAIVTAITASGSSRLEIYADLLKQIFQLTNDLHRPIAINGFLNSEQFVSVFSDPRWVKGQTTMEIQIETEQEIDFWTKAPGGLGLIFIIAGCRSKTRTRQSPSCHLIDEAKATVAIQIHALSDVTQFG